MEMIELDGWTNEAGELEVKLPEGLPPGDVKVRIQVAREESVEIPWEEQPWTEEEVQALFASQPAKTGAEIVAMIESGELDLSGWKDIEDSVAWVEDVRRRAWEERQHRD